MPRRNDRRSPKARRRAYALRCRVQIVELTPTYDEMARDLVRRGLASSAILGSRPKRPAPANEGEAA